MPRFKCSVCDGEFEEKYFDVAQNKCILHCEKNQDTGWLDENKTWNMQKVNFFWDFIQNRLNSINEQCNYGDEILENKNLYENVIFPKFKLLDLEDENVIIERSGINFFSRIEQHDQENLNTIFNRTLNEFKKCIFLDETDFSLYKWEKPIKFYKCEFRKKIKLPKIFLAQVSFARCDFNKNGIYLKNTNIKNNFFLKNCKNILNLDLSESTFEGKVKIQSCEIIGKSNFYNTKFNDLADFYYTTFNKVNFEKTDFNNISIFSETIFNKDIDFKYTKFLDKAVFRDTVFKKKLNLRNSIFDDDVNFLDITSEKGSIKDIIVANRETARIIKNFLDRSGNIIDANKFYSLELKERGKEIKISKNPFEWLIFKLHGLSSNHSQNWLSALLWIIFIGIVKTSYYAGEDYYFALLFLFLSYLIFSNINISIFVTIVLFKLLLTTVSLNSIANTINPFSSVSDMSFIELVFKAIMAYLIYQFVVSVRQNTRRG